MIRRFFREGLAWVAVSGAILGAALWGSAPAKADSVDRLICAVLDEYPTADGVYGVGLGLIYRGYTPYDAGRQIRHAVDTTCPEHLDAVLEFININNRGTAV